MVMKISNDWTARVSANIYGAGSQPVTVSEGRSFSLALNSLILPTRENAENLSAAQAGTLSRAFQDAGISTNPSVDLSVDHSSGYIRVSGNRSDTKQIENLINGNPDLATQIRTTNAIWSHVFAIERSGQYSALRFTGSEVQPLTDSV